MTRTERLAAIPQLPTASADAPTVPAIKRVPRRAPTPPVDATATQLALAELALDDLLGADRQPHGIAANSAGNRTS